MGGLATKDELGMGKEPPGEEEDATSKTKNTKQVPNKGPRKRVSQACDRCRSRKDKCNGQKPACSTCISNGRTCSYDTNVKKRGLPEGYVRGMEKLWGLAIRDVEDIEDNLLDAIKGDEGNLESPLQTWNDEANSENLVNIWRKSHLSRELERLLSSLEPLIENSKRKRQDLDRHAVKRADTGASPPALLPGGSGHIGISNSGWPKEPSESRQLGSYTDYAHLPRSGGSTGFEARESAPIVAPSSFYGREAGSAPVTSDNLTDLPLETWHLLDVYFSYTHPWLPIIEKHDLLRTSYQYSEQNRSSSGSGDHAALWAAIAYAKFQHRAINKTPLAQDPVRGIVWTAERMYAQARDLIPNEESCFELGHLQALLILTLVNIGIGKLGRAWLLIGQAVRISIDLGLDRPSNSASNHSKPKSRLKHTFLGCFAIETILAARLGRRPHLRADDLDAVGFIEEDGLEEWDPWIDCLTVRKISPRASRMPATILGTYNRLIHVVKILNEAISAPRSMNALQFSIILLEKLHVWSQSLTPPIHFDISALSSDQELSLLPHHYHLHIVYFTTLATCQLLAHQRSNENVNLEQCTRSAYQISELLIRHSQNFGLLIVPPTYEYFIKSAYDIVHEVQGSIENTHIVLNDWKPNLDICIMDIEPAWAAFDSLRNSVSNRTSSHARRESEVAFDLISGLSQIADTPILAKTPQSLTGFETPAPCSPQVFFGQANGQKSRTTNHTMRGQPPTSFHRSQSSGQSSVHGLPLPPSGYQNARSILIRNDSVLSKPPVAKGWQQSGLFPPIEAPPPLDPRLQSNRSVISDQDTDPLANEFAALDAMEWTGNWDQSLVNLGFTDRDNMSQDFYAFCQEPDPLHPNSVFQQLVANSNAEATNFLDESSLSMGGFGMGYGDENEGIEAGQILQALSASEDQLTSIV